ncbi:hypothetical protein QTP88_028510 [Uroleucon formosanum]
MRKTRDGHVLVELDKGAGSALAAQKLSSAIAIRLGDAVGGVSQLSQYAVVEIVDLDAVATKDEVLSALRAAIPGSDDDQAAICERQAMQITGLWPTRSGQQIATARMTRAVASSISRVPIGWTMCRVRPRRSEPEKCFRCHGFGHQSGNCSGPDLSSNCKRCGEPGHELKQCLADKDLCVACERAGFERYEHKPGSGMCKARKEAIKKPTGRNPQTQSRQSLLQQTSAATGAQILIVSEQNWNPTHDDRWVASTDGTCAVALTATADFVPDLIGAGRAFAWIQSRGIRIYSCYISRNDTDANFANFLGDVEQSVRSVDLHCSVIIGGDFNAWSQEWGSARNDARGDQLADLTCWSATLVPSLRTAE